MAMLHELIQESKNSVPSRQKRMRLQEAINDELTDGAAYDANWYGETIRLWENLYSNICRLQPTSHTERVEKIMWKHDTQATLIKTRSQRMRYDELHQKMLIQGAKGLFSTGVFAALKKSFGMMTNARELSEIALTMTDVCRNELERLRQETKKELKDIGVSEWPD